jgi:hypothetical protein
MDGGPSEVADETSSAHVLLPKSKERNRMHARKTRLRKKAMLEGLKGRLVGLQDEVTFVALDEALCDNE